MLKWLLSLSPVQHIALKSEIAVLLWENSNIWSILRIKIQIRHSETPTRGNHVASRIREVQSLMGPHLERCVQLWGTSFRKDTEVVEHVEWKSVKLVKGLEHGFYEEWLRDQWLFNLEKGRLMRRTSHSRTTLKNILMKWVLVSFPR